MTETNRTVPADSPEIAAAKRIYQAWDDALGARDADAAARLYTADCELESPLVCHLLGRDEGVVRGRAALRAFAERVFASQPALRQRYRTGFFTDGRRLMWEYPRVTDTGQQIDLVEVMELQDGLIHRHRVYWGWLGVNVLRDNRHHPD